MHLYIDFMPQALNQQCEYKANKIKTGALFDSNEINVKGVDFFLIFFPCYTKKNTLTALVAFVY